MSISCGGLLLIWDLKKEKQICFFLFNILFSYQYDFQDKKNEARELMKNLIEKKFDFFFKEWSDYNFSINCSTISQKQFYYSENTFLGQD